MLSSVFDENMPFRSSKRRSRIVTRRSDEMFRLGSSGHNRCLSESFVGLTPGSSPPDRLFCARSACMPGSPSSGEDERLFAPVVPQASLRMDFHGLRYANCDTRGSSTPRRRDGLNAMRAASLADVKRQSVAFFEVKFMEATMNPMLSQADKSELPRALRNIRSSTTPPHGRAGSAARRAGSFRGTKCRVRAAA